VGSSLFVPNPTQEKAVEARRVWTHQFSVSHNRSFAL
jgi:hypothetical protein